MPYRDPQENSDKTNARAAKISRLARDIGEKYPPPGDLVRRGSCEFDLLLFLSTYFPNAFPLQWSADHEKVIARMEKSILEGGLFAISMPRGGGKTSMATRAA